MNNCNSNTIDFAKNKKTMLYLWVIPGVLLITGLLLYWQSTIWSGVLCSISLLWAGIGCVANSIHCKRVHCTFTGPLYIVLGIISAIITIGYFSISWKYVWIALIVGTFLAFLPELLGKKYWKSNSKY